MPTAHANIYSYMVVFFKVLQTLKPLVVKLQKRFYMSMFLEYLYVDVTTLKAFFAVAVTVYKHLTKLNELVNDFSIP